MLLFIFFSLSLRLKCWLSFLLIAVLGEVVYFLKLSHKPEIECFTIALSLCIVSLKESLEEDRIGVRGRLLETID